MSNFGNSKNPQGRNRSNPLSPPNKKAQRRLEADERNKKYQALSLSDKVKGAGQKVLAKLAKQFPDEVSKLGRKVAA